MTGNYSVELNNRSRDDKVIAIDVESLFRGSHADLINSDLSIKYRFMLTEFQLTIYLPSLAESDPPDVSAADTDAAIKAKVEGVKRNSEIIRLGIFERSAQSHLWHKRAALRLSNYGGESYKSILRPYFGRSPVVSLGLKNQIALGVIEKRKGDVRIGGFLGSEDFILASVQYRDELTLVHRARMPVSRSRSFGVEISDQSQLIVPFNKDRKVLLLTNAGSNPAFISSGEEAEVDKGFYLSAGGALTLEEGKYSVPLQFFGVTSEGSTLITGEEWM